MSKKEFNFWQDHSPNYLAMAFRYNRDKSIENPDGYGKKTGECGDTIEMFLTIRGNCVKLVNFETDGCLNTRACANTVAHLAEEKTIEQAKEITFDDVIYYLKTLRPENRHCAELAVGALYLALGNYQRFKRDSQKKLYQIKIEREVLVCMLHLKLIELFEKDTYVVTGEVGPIKGSTPGTGLLSPNVLRKPNSCMEGSMA
jgi:nitrogen fixation NifU-like protein